MFAVHTWAPGRTRIALAPMTPLARPWNRVVHVHLLHEGAHAALVDTGLPSSRAPLMAALEHLGVSPSRVRRILLTGLGPASTGNLESFPDVPVLSVSEDGLQELCPETRRAASSARLLRAVAALSEVGALSQEEGERAVEALLDGLFGKRAPRRTVMGIRDGSEIAVDSARLEALSAPGSEEGSCVYHDGASGDLYGGRALVFDEHFPVLRIDAVIASFDRLSQLSPRRILPLTGLLQEDHRAAFRSLGLLVHGALSHLPYAFAGPTRAVDLARRDFGDGEGQPIVLIARTLRYEVLLDELARSGVVEREGEGPLAVHHGGSAQGSRTAALLAEVRARRAARGTGES